MERGDWLVEMLDCENFLQGYTWYHLLREDTDKELFLRLSPSHMTTLLSVRYKYSFLSYPG